jgi:hypothetical protein
MRKVFKVLGCAWLLSYIVNAASLFSLAWFAFLVCFALPLLPRALMLVEQVRSQVMAQKNNATAHVVTASNNHVQQHNTLANLSVIAPNQSMNTSVGPITGARFVLDAKSPEPRPLIEKFDSM